MAASEHERYLLTEWEGFERDPHRVVAAREAVAEVAIRRVLDVGCGAGQELRPFLDCEEALRVGIDIAPEVGRVGPRLFAALAPGVPITFVRAASENLPFRSGSFDVAICRLALPYTDNDRTFEEIARVLQAGGVLLLKIHHARFYFYEFAQAVRRRRPRAVLQSLRVLTAGLIYHLTGRQMRNRWLGRETFQTVWMLRRQLTARGLSISRELPDSNPLTPSFVIQKPPALSAVRVTGKELRSDAGPARS